MEKLKVGDAELGLLARMLRRVDFFAPLTVGQIEQILPYILLYAFGAGETVFKQGQPGDAFYIVYKGRVDVKIKKGLFSFSKAVASLGPGDFFGEMALLDSAPRSATVVTSEPSQLFALVSRDFQFVAKSNPSMAAEMEKVAARRKFESTHRQS